PVRESVFSGTYEADGHCRPAPRGSQSPCVHGAFVPSCLCAFVPIHHKGTKAQRHKGTKAQRHKGTKAILLSTVRSPILTRPHSHLQEHLPLTNRPTQPVTKKEILGWCFYDVADSSFTTVIVTVLFAVYYTKIVAGHTGYGDSLWA